MAKGYWVVSVDVSDPEGYKLYVAENAKAFQKYGARFLVRGGKAEAVEGTGRSRNVVIEFKDHATALACYRSPEYVKAIDLRRNKAVADIIDRLTLLFQARTRASRLIAAKRAPYGHAAPARAA
jgi:uncharacterized protein (DUF1330 family)